METTGRVPEITPVEELRLRPEGRLDPFAKEYVTESESVTDNAGVVILEFVKNSPKEPELVTHTGAAFAKILNCLLTAGFDPSDAVSVNVYVVLEATLAKVPERRPVAVFNVMPEGSVEPDATA